MDPWSLQFLRENSPPRSRGSLNRTDPYQDCRMGGSEEGGRVTTHMAFCGVGAGGQTMGDKVEATRLEM